MENPLLELRNITKEFSIGGGLGLGEKKSIKAVDNVSFGVSREKPTILALVGESGSGKTTISRIILGLLEPTSGEILYEGRDVRNWIKKDRKAYRRNVQVIFQDPYGIYNPFYRVDRVLFKSVKKFGLASSSEEANNMVVESMRAMGLRPEDLLGRYPHQLSGGERQRLMLVRILLINPKLVIADEPVSMIDVSLRSIFLNNLQDLRSRLRMSTIYITHDLNIAHYISDEIMVLCYGRIVETGETKSVVKNPLHPYTQGLVSAIPIPDPRKRWKDTIEIEEVTFKKLQTQRQRCIYSHRCPHVTPVCKEQIPPLMEVEPGRRAACFLYPEVLEAIKSE
ncbi:MAG: ABC transporter ATP-binding protein [Candidatus Bathyarchaeota archaeon]|nr:ABC transporter ATP-binding protein [Candidatus Bathyarchaeota archaeon]